MSSTTFGTSSSWGQTPRNEGMRSRRVDRLRSGIAEEIVRKFDVSGGTLPGGLRVDGTLAVGDDVDVGGTIAVGGAAKTRLFQELAHAEDGRVVPAWRRATYRDSAALDFGLGSETDQYLDGVYAEELGLFMLPNAGVNVGTVTNVGAARSVAVSPNGYEWSRRGIAGTPAAYNGATYRAIAWSPELSKAVVLVNNATGTSGARAIHSSNGFTWELGNTPAEADGCQWQAAAWSPALGRFIAVGNHPASPLRNVMISSDGVSWELQTGALAGLSHVIWVPEQSQFVACRDSGSADSIVTSPDGITWTVRSSPRGANTLAWSPKLGVILGTIFGESDLIASYDGGVTWARIPTEIGQTGWVNIKWAPGIDAFAAVSYRLDYAGSYDFMFSTDGVAWTGMLSDTEFAHVALVWSRSQRRFVVGQNADSNTRGQIFVGEVGSASQNGYFALSGEAMPAADAYAAESRTLSTWQARNSGAFLSGIAWVPDLRLFVAVGANAIATSPDGFTWTARTPPNASSWRAAAWSPTRRVISAVGQGTTPGTAALMTSSNGETWTAQSAAAASNALNAVCWSPELALFVAVGQAGTLITSPDGRTWLSRAAPSGTGIHWKGIAWSPLRSCFVAVGEVVASGAAAVMSSADGIVWAEVQVQASGPLRAVAWSQEQGVFCAVGASGALVTSSDGAAWAQQQAPAAEEWRSVAWAAELGCFVAVGISGAQRVMTSVGPGTTWRLRSHAGPADNAYAAVAWSPELGMAAAVADGGSVATERAMSTLLRNRAPTAFTLFDDDSNRISEAGNWTLQQAILAGPYADGSTAPSVVRLNLLEIANTAPTQITAFADGAEGQELTLLFLDNNTTVVHNASLLRLAGNANFAAAADSTLRLLRSDGVWVELSRSVNSV